MDMRKDIYDVACQNVNSLLSSLKYHIVNTGIIYS